MEERHPTVIVPTSDVVQEAGSPLSTKSRGSRKSRKESARSSGRRSNNASNKSKDGSQSPTNGGIPARTFNLDLEDEIVAQIEAHQRQRLEIDPMRELDEALMDRTTASQNRKHKIINIQSKSNSSGQRQKSDENSAASEMVVVPSPSNTSQNKRNLKFISK